MHSEAKGIQTRFNELIGEFAQQIVAQLRDEGYQIQQVPVGKRETIRASVMNLVADHDHLTSSMVADELEGSVVSSSANPRKVIQSAISAMVADGTLSKDRFGRLAAVEQQEVVLA